MDWRPKTPPESSANQGDYESATTLLLEAYGPEVYGFLRSRTRDADDVYAVVTADVWKGIAGFQWRCTARTWLYTLARHAAIRWENKAHRRHELLMSEIPWLSGLAHRTRTSTPAHQRSELKDEVRRLREALSDDEQTLLILRVDKRMPWKELAVVMAAEGDALDEAERKRLAARLRKRFQLLKGKLRKMAVEQGLIGSDDGGP